MTGHSGFPGNATSCLLSSVFSIILSRSMTPPPTKASPASEKQSSLEFLLLFSPSCTQNGLGQSLGKRKHMAVSLLDKVSEIQTLSIKKAKRWFLFRYNFHNFQPSLESVTFALVSSLSLSLSLSPSLPPSLTPFLTPCVCYL